MTIGRPKQFDAERAVSMATEQFWRGGYFATSLQDLLDCMKLSKSSLYQSFGNKEQLFVHCLEHYQQELDLTLNAMLERAPSGLTFVKNLLDSVITEADIAEPKGCLLVNTANELAGREAAIARAVKRGLETIKSNLKQALERAKRDGELPADSDLDQLSDFLVAGISGLRTMVKAGASKEKLEKVADLLFASLK